MSIRLSSMAEEDAVDDESDLSITELNDQIDACNNFEQDLEELESKGKLEFP